jgi:hypothetical protein
MLAATYRTSHDKRTLHFNNKKSLVLKMISIANSQHKTFLGRHFHPVYLFYENGWNLFRMSCKST